MWSVWLLVGAAGSVLYLVAFRVVEERWEVFGYSGLFLATAVYLRSVLERVVREIVTVELAAYELHRHHREHARAQRRRGLQDEGQAVVPIQPRPQDPKDRR